MKKHKLTTRKRKGGGYTVKVETRYRKFVTPVAQEFLTSAEVDEICHELIRKAVPATKVGQTFIWEFDRHGVQFKATCDNRRDGIIVMIGRPHEIEFEPAPGASKPLKTGFLPSPMPISALFDSTGLRPDARSALLEADLIFGVDVHTGNEFLMYGVEVLRRIMQTGQAENSRIVAISLIQSTDQLEVLCAAVEVIRGRCDYGVSV